MIVVSDASPIIALTKINKLNILYELYNDVHIPKTVYKEITSNVYYENEANIVKNSNFIKIVEVNQEESAKIKLIGGIHEGESEAIFYAHNNNCDLLLIDNERARNVARNMDINIRGTIGILIEAYEKNILTKEEIFKCEEKLKKTSMYISDELYGYLEESVKIINKKDKVESISDICNRLDDNDDNLP